MWCVIKTLSLFLLPSSGHDVHTAVYHFHLTVDVNGRKRAFQITQVKPVKNLRQIFLNSYFTEQNTTLETKLSFRTQLLQLFDLFLV